MHSEERPRPNISIRKIALIIFLSILIIGCVSTYGIYQSNIQPVQENSEAYIFEVIEGDTLDSIVQRLEEEGIIKSAFFSKVDAKLNGTDGFIVGSFMIDKSWTVQDILSYLCEQDNIESTSVLITFIEGVWAKDVANKLSNYYDYDAQDFIDLWNDEAFIYSVIDKYDFLDESIMNEEYVISLEGYLFPETYMFDYDMSMEEITYVFLDYFNVVFTELKDEVLSSQFSTHEWVSLASVVQYESATVYDMQNIAQVFLNRLAIGMKLQSSVTVCYALYEFDSWEECESEYDYDSLYNTYVYEGLPIGPILNPGYDALYAVLNPIDNDYLFFLADVYGDGTVYYSYTYEEHLAKQKEYLGY